MRGGTRHSNGTRLGASVTGPGSRLTASLAANPRPLLTAAYDFVRGRGLRLWEQRMGAGLAHVVPVSTLPFPFHLFRCPFEQRHLRALELVGADQDDWETPEQCAGACELFVADLGTDMAACPYHLPDWKLAAQRAVEAVRLDGSHAEVNLQGLNEQTEWAAYDLFAEPIFLTGDRLGNGQHRTCAMKCAGVAAVPIEGYRRRQPPD
jgi:hypothetical protein